MLVTHRRELENYYPVAAIRESLQADGRYSTVQLAHQCGPDTDVPDMLRQAIAAGTRADPPRPKTVKKWLADTAARRITRDQLRDLGAYDEVTGWFKLIGELARSPS